LTPAESCPTASAFPEKGKDGRRGGGEWKGDEEDGRKRKKKEGSGGRGCYKTEGGGGKCKRGGTKGELREHLQRNEERDKRGNTGNKKEKKKEQKTGMKKKSPW
jgi:hypothetical protein